MIGTARWSTPTTRSTTRSTRFCENVGFVPGRNTWYIGDSTTDTVAAKNAGVTSIFYNGAGWDRHWLDKIFPGTVRHPHQPDAVVNDSAELLGLVTQFLDR